MEWIGRQKCYLSVSNEWWKVRHYQKSWRFDKNNLFPEWLWFPYSCKRIRSLQTAWKTNEINILNPILIFKCIGSFTRWHASFRYVCVKEMQISLPSISKSLLCIQYIYTLKEFNIYAWNQKRKPRWINRRCSINPIFFIMIKTKSPTSEWNITDSNILLFPLMPLSFPYFSWCP